MLSCSIEGPIQSLGPKELRFCLHWHSAGLLAGAGSRWELCPHTPIIGSRSALAMNVQSTLLLKIIPGKGKAKRVFV